ncbi:semaphorin-1A [Bombyx mori]|uniref:Sema domain-containing protein n=1 Tax=Bombyx mori TaxID=7091 RepID=A0A8R2HRR9_BOMMO|nr:semaphorin-1A [Bombyx mori]XP_021206213.1 semaphorin-1A [Bombyx mori]
MAVARAVLVLLASTAQAWMPDSNARIHVKYGDENSEQFVGNATAPDHFRILDRDDFSIIVGGRNTVYNLSLYDLSENVDQRLEWQSTEAHKELCQLKGKSPDECQNYPRIAVRAHGRFLVCGTNAFKPQCRRYGRHPPYRHIDEFDGSGRCPYDPQHNSTSVFVDGQLYTATAADFSGTDPLIYREPVRTGRSDLLLLNDPSFVGSVASTSHAYFFYRETAVEYMNCGKAVYSRVARICLNDKGGPNRYSDQWMSFLKARMNCSMPGDYPFYFDEIQATTELINGIYGSGNSRNDIMYAVFTTPQNAIGGSAVCAFAMRDIIDAFEGLFKGQENWNSNWLPVKKEKIPQTRPGSCVEDSRTLSDEVVNFVKAHPLMDKAVPSFLARPILIRVSLQYRFSAIAVHPQVQAMNGNKYDVLYIGTDDGRVIKAVNVASNEGVFDASVDEYSKNPVRTAVISEEQVLPQGVPIKQMHVALTTEKLIVASGDIIKAVTLSHCGNVQSCRECVSLQDPHCAWDSKEQQCSWVGNRQFPNPERFLQNVEHGKTDICNKLPALLPGERHSNRNPGTKKPSSSESEARQKTDDIQNEIFIEEVLETNVIAEEKNSHNNKHETDLLTVEAADGNIYSAQALFTAVVASCLVTLMVGFVFGYLFSRRFRHPFFSDSPPFNEQHNHLNRLSPLETPLNANSAYLPPRSKNVNMVANVCPLAKQDNLHLELGKERTLDLRNSTESLDKDLKCGTLQKVKKTYI